MKTTRAKIGSPAWNQAKAEGRAVYCGRACHRSKEPLAKVTSPYHNPFKIGSTWKNRAIYNKEEAIEAFREYWYGPAQAKLRQQARELKGKVLGCFCKEGKPCHCDPIIEDIERDGE